MYRQGVTISALGHPVDRVTAAQAADELLTVSGVNASFVLFPADPGRGLLSPLCRGAFNAPYITYALGGGGNAAVAGAQIPEKTVETVLSELQAAIDRYCEEP